MTSDDMSVIRIASDISFLRYFKIPRQKLLLELKGTVENSIAEATRLKDTQANLSRSLNVIEQDMSELLQSSQRLAEAFATVTSS